MLISRVPGRLASTTPVCLEIDVSLPDRVPGANHVALEFLVVLRVRHLMCFPPFLLTTRRGTANESMGRLNYQKVENPIMPS